MADDPKALTNEQKELVRVWVEKHWTQSRNCPICGSLHWLGPQYVVQPLTHVPMGQIQFGGGPGYPLVLVICQTCGYTMAFNAIMVGLFPKQQTLPPKPQTEQTEAANAQG